MKLLRTLIDSVKSRLDPEANKPWEFAPPDPKKTEPPLDERRAAEQARQIKLGYSVEMVSKGEGVRYTEGLRYVEANIAWSEGVRLWLNTMREWTKPDRRPMTAPEFTKVLTRICEYLGCDGKEVTLVDQTPPSWRKRCCRASAAGAGSSATGSWSRSDRPGSASAPRWGSRGIRKRGFLLPPGFRFAPSGLRGPQRPPEAGRYITTQRLKVLPSDAARRTLVSTSSSSCTSAAATSGDSPKCTAAPGSSFRCDNRASRAGIASCGSNHFAEAMYS